MNHPVVNLLEKNIRKIYANEIFMNDKSFNVLKEFNGMALNDSENNQRNVYEQFEILNIKKRMNNKKKAIKTNF